MTIETMEALTTLADGTLLREDGSDSVWRVSDGHLVWNGARVPFAMFASRLASLSIDTGDPRVGQVYGRGSSRHVLVHVNPDERVRYLTFEHREGGEWRYMGNGVVPIRTFRDFTLSEESLPAGVRQLVDDFRATWNEAQAQATQHTCPPEGINRFEMQDRLSEWMEENEEVENDSLRRLMQDFGMTPPEATEDIDWSCIVRGSIYRDVDDVTEDYTLTLEPQINRVEYVWEVGLDGRMEDMPEGECICPRIDRDVIRDRMREMGHGDVIVASDSWDYEDMDCDHG